MELDMCAINTNLNSSFYGSYGSYNPPLLDPDLSDEEFPIQDYPVIPELSFTLADLDDLFSSCDRGDSPVRSPMSPCKTPSQQPIAPIEEEPAGEYALVESGDIEEELTSGPLIAICRDKMGLSQAQLGRMIGAKQERISGYEADSRIKELHRINLSDVLKVNIERLRPSGEKKECLFVNEEGEVIGGENFTAGKRLRAVREERGLSANDLSRKLGGKPSGRSIHSMETCDSISASLAKACAEELGVEDYIVFCSKKPIIKERVVEVVDGEVIGGEELALRELLFELRMNLGLTQEDLGLKVEISGSHISEYESGNKRITPKGSEKLARFFKITNLRKFCPSKEVKTESGQVIGGEGHTPRELLRALREGYQGAGLSQRDLSAKTEIGQAQISKYEAGQEIKKKDSIKLANFFKITNTEIFCSVKGPHVCVENGKVKGAMGLLCGGIVRGLRKWRGLTPEELSQRIGGVLGGHTIQSLETTNKISLRAATLFAQEFGITDDDGVTDPTPLTPKKSDVTRSTSTTRSKKRKRSDTRT
jgi:transcriptional regulator with XRE-family HTH domain